MLTGRKRKAKGKYGSGRMDTEFTREYRCLDCDHVGWSRHIDLRGKEKHYNDLKGKEKR